MFDSFMETECEPCYLLWNKSVLVSLLENIVHVAFWKRMWHSFKIEVWLNINLSSNMTIWLYLLVYIYIFRHWLKKSLTVINNVINKVLIILTFNNGFIYFFHVWISENNYFMALVICSFKINLLYFTNCFHL